MYVKILILLAIYKLASSAPGRGLAFNVKQDVNTGCKNGCINPKTNDPSNLIVDSVEDNDISTGYTQKGQCNIKAKDNQCGLTAKQIMTTASGGTATRGIFISLHNKNLFKIRRQALEVQDDIILLGSELPDHFHSREFEKKTSSNEFLKVVDTFGMQMAAEANYENLFVEAKGGVTVNYDKEETKERKTSRNSEYASAIKCYNVPIKSIELDPWNIRLDSRVLKELIEIENKISNSDNQNVLFNDYFEQFGSHFQIGLFELGGTIFIKSEASGFSSESFEEYKETVKRSLDAYAELSITGAVASGGGSVSTNANELKDQISGNSKDETLKNVSLEREQRGGPAGEDNIELWKKGLAEDCDTWRIINKPTELITTWDLIMLHYNNTSCLNNTPSCFKNATRFTGDMKKAWEAIIDKELSVQIPALFEKLGISSTTARKRRQLIVDMLTQEPVYGVKNFNPPAFDEVTQTTLDGNDITMYARVSVIIGGAVVMSALKEEEVDHDTNSILPFYSLTFLPERPYTVYIRLEHNDLYLGDIIFVLDGYEAPMWAQQFLELSTGDNNVGGAWRGAGFEGIGNLGAPGENILCTGYMNANGLQTDSLFPVEDEGTDTALVTREVRGYAATAFFIATRSDPNWEPGYPVIGHVTSESLGILQAVLALDWDIVKDITFTNCGLVIID